MTRRIEKPEVRVYRELARVGGGKRAIHIASSLGMKRMTVLKLLHRLEEQGKVVRYEDQRVWHIPVPF